MILGALVADAASMGLHWIYDQARIKDVALDAPEFMQPDPKNYDGVPAYFAHRNRAAGALSQYGEQAMVMLRTLAASDGQYDQAEFTDQFRNHFGYGGAYVGYIDHATRDTLDNLRRFEDAAFDRAQSLPFEGDAKTLKTLVAKALPLLARYSGDDLTSKFQSVLAEGDPALLPFADQLITTLSKLPSPAGAHDLQLPAIAKLPGLVATLVAQGITEGSAFDDAVSSAVRVTNDHPVAAEYGAISAHMMAGALTHGTSTGAIGAARKVAGADACIRLDKALEMREQDNQAVTKHFGMSCDLPFGVPSATHNIITATSFAGAIQQNIYSGGDSCGRAILVGAVMGAVYGIGGPQGIPQSWVDRVEQKAEVDQLLHELFGMV